MKANRNHSGRIEVANGLRAVAGAAFAYRRAFAAACRHDGIAEDAKIVCFSKGNPYEQFIDPALRQYRETRAAYQAGGYVGLTMSGGRAR